MNRRIADQRPTYRSRFLWKFGVSLASSVAIAFGATGQEPDRLPAAKDSPKVVPPAVKSDLPAPTTPPSTDRSRLNRLGERGLGAVPKPTAEDLKEFNQFVDSVIDPKNTLDIIEGRTRLILLKTPPTQTQIADDGIAGLNLLGEKQVTVLGKRVGTTVLTLWFPDPANPKKEKILSYLVRVIPDPTLKDRLEKIYEGLEKELSTVFPDSQIRLSLVGDKLVVRGQAKDVAEASQILRIVNANAPGGGNQREEDELSARKVPVNNLTVNVNPLDPLNEQGTPGLDQYQLTPGPNVINLLRIPGEQQVMLRVTVAEVSRSAARSIGLNFSVINNAGVPVFTNNTGQLLINGAQAGGAGLLAAGAGGGAGLLGQGRNVNANLPVVLDNGQIPIAINALRTLNYARSLAEPNLVALNGKSAFFRSGGQFPVPVLGGFGQAQNGQGGLQGVQFVPFGVQLQFTPVITDRDRIRLNVNASVSTRDIASGTTIAGATVSGLNTRDFRTIVEMREGQTLAVAGLIQNNLGGSSSRVPFLGDMPVVGRLFSSDQISSGEQELVILISPELVHPLEKKELTPLPGADIFEPDDCEFYLHGRLESHRAMDFRSSVMTDVHRIKAWKRCEQNYIFGPVGHTTDANYPPLLPPSGGR